MKLVFKYARGRFEGYGKVVKVHSGRVSVVRPDGWTHDIGVTEKDICPDDTGDER